MENVEITPKELYDALQSLSSGVYRIQTEVAVINNQLSSVQQATEAYQILRTKQESLEKDVEELSTEVDTLREQLAAKDRNTIRDFVSVIVLGGALVLLEFFILN